MNLLVDDEDKARLNRERVAEGYGNEGYDAFDYRKRNAPRITVSTFGLHERHGEQTSGLGGWEYESR